MKLYILRHGETEWNREDRVQGQMDSPLTKKGREDIASMAEELFPIPIEICYTSDLPRAKKTAEGLINGRKIPIIEVEALRELPLGPWEGKLFKEIQKDPLSVIYFESPDQFSLPGLRNFHDLYKGVGDFIRKLEKDPKDHVLIVAHGVSIRALLNVLEGVPVARFWHRPIAKSMGLTIASFEKGKWKVLQRADQKDGLSY